VTTSFLSCKLSSMRIWRSRREAVGEVPLASWPFLYSPYSDHETRYIIEAAHQAAMWSRLDFSTWALLKTLVRS
jgi:hypothetical protein